MSLTLFTTLHASPSMIVPTRLTSGADSTPSLFTIRTLVLSVSQSVLMEGPDKRRRVSDHSSADFASDRRFAAASTSSVSGSANPSSATATMPAATLGPNVVVTDSDPSTNFGSSQTGVIIGATLGAVAGLLLVLLVGAGLYVRRRTKRRRDEEAQLGRSANPADSQMMRQVVIEEGDVLDIRRQVVSHPAAVPRNDSRENWREMAPSSHPYRVSTLIPQKSHERPRRQEEDALYISYPAPIAESDASSIRAVRYLGDERPPATPPKDRRQRERTTPTAAAGSSSAGRSHLRVGSGSDVSYAPNLSQASSSAGDRTGTASTSSGPSRLRSPSGPSTPPSSWPHGVGRSASATSETASPSTIRVVIPDTPVRPKLTEMSSSSAMSTATKRSLRELPPPSGPPPRTPLPSRPDSPPESMPYHAHRRPTVPQVGQRSPAHPYAPYQYQPTSTEGAGPSRSRSNSEPTSNRNRSPRSDPARSAPPPVTIDTSRKRASASGQPSTETPLSATTTPTAATPSRLRRLRRALLFSSIEEDLRNLPTIPSSQTSSFVAGPRSSTPADLDSIFDLMDAAAQRSPTSAATQRASFLNAHTNAARIGVSPERSRSSTRSTIQGTGVGYVSQPNTLPYNEAGTSRDHRRRYQNQILIREAERHPIEMNVVRSSSPPKFTPPIVITPEPRIQRSRAATVDGSGSRPNPL